MKDMNYEELIEFVDDYLKEHENDLWCYGRSVRRNGNEAYVVDGLGPMVGPNRVSIEEYYQEIKRHMSVEALNSKIEKIKEKKVRAEENKKSDGVALYLKAKEKKINKLAEKNKTFGVAIEAMKQGKKVAREGWNGKNMFLWLKPTARIKSEWCKDPMLKGLADMNGGELDALGTICMFTAQKQVLTGWLASQTDMLSDDWMILD